MNVLSQMVKISSLSLYIINRVIYRLYVLGILQSKFSLILEKRDTYVNNVKNENMDAVFNPIDFPLIAAALNWKVHDLLPPDNSPYSDGTLVDKVVFSLINPSDAQEVIVGMEEIGYFKKKKSLKDIFKHLDLTENEIEKRKVIIEVLEKLISNGVLKLQNENYIA